MLPIPWNKCSFSLKDTAEMIHSTPSSKVVYYWLPFFPLPWFGGTTNPLERVIINGVCVYFCEGFLVEFTSNWTFSDFLIAWWDERDVRIVVCYRVCLCVCVCACTCVFLWRISLEFTSKLNLFWFSDCTRMNQTVRIVVCYHGSQGFVDKSVIR